MLALAVTTLDYGSLRRGFTNNAHRTGCKGLLYWYKVQEYKY